MGHLRNAWRCGAPRFPEATCAPRCVVLKRGLADKKVAFVWAQREVDRSSEAERPRISPQRMPLAGPCGLSKLNALGDLQDGGQILA